MCRLIQLITLANIRNIIYAVHPAPFELVVCWAFPAYILDEIKPCNLDLVKQFTRITGINCGNGLGTYNAIHRNTKQALRNSVRTGCNQLIYQQLIAILSHQPSICPSTWFQNFRPFLF